MLWGLVATHGKKWTEVAKQMTQMTLCPRQPYHLRTRYQMLFNKQQRETTSAEVLADQH